MARKSNTRGAQGAGSIRKKTVMRNGKEYSYWEARVTVGTNPGTGKQIQKSITGKTQKEVQTKRAELIAQVDSGAYIEPCRMNLSEWLDTWLETYCVDIKPNTRQNYAYMIRCHIKPALGAVKLEALTTPTIQRFYNSLSEGSDNKPALAPKSVKICHGVLHGALSKAVALGYLRFNPSDNCTLPRVEKRAQEVLEADKAIEFMDAIKGHRFEAVYQVALFTGLREGEICGLTWDCVDLERGTLLVNKQLQRVPGQKAEFALVSTKSGRWRTITLAPTVVTILRKHRIAQLEMQLKAGPAWSGQENFVFCNETGEHLSPHTVYHCFKRIVASIGMPTMRFHDLRHSYATTSLKSGDDIKTVQTNLGHSDASTTLNIYSHCTEQMKKESAARTEQYIQSISAGI